MWNRHTHIALAAIVLAAAVVSAQSVEPEVVFRVDVRGSGVTGAATPLVDGTRTWSVAANCDRGVDIEARVQMSFDQRLGCTRDLATLSADGVGERFFTDSPDGNRFYGCSNGIDDDGDGALDAEDCDCVGVQGWAFSMVVGDCFDVTSATVVGTTADLSSRPPGVRDTDGSFAKTEIVEPHLSQNNGRRGVVSSIVFSWTNPIILPDGEHDLLRVLGHARPQPSDDGSPCVLRILSGDDALVGSREPVPTSATVGGETASYAVETSVLEFECQAVFRRGDVNQSGGIDLTDAIAVAMWLFLGSAPPVCLDGADVEDDGEIAVTDPIYLVNWLFLGGPPPLAPGPTACGTDPTEDSLPDCTAPLRCP